jgi:transcriptional regulator
VDVLPGTLDGLILRGLTWGPKHGYAVARWIEQSSGDALTVLDGALYAALHRMEARKWIVAEWGLSSSGRRVKFYRLTPLGRTELTAEQDNWKNYVSAMGKVMRTSTEPA